LNATERTIVLKEWKREKELERERDLLQGFVFTKLNMPPIHASFYLHVIYLTIRLIK